MNRFKQRYFKLSKNKQYDHAVLYFVDLPNYKLPATRHGLSMFFNPENILIKITVNQVTAEFA